MSQGIVFNIQKFSIHDGPGIRTTVFLKGCPLKCLWCSNPESQLEKIQILYNQNKCIHCQACIHTCSHHAIEYINHHIHIQFNKCAGCLQCINVCPQNALSHEGEYKHVNEVVDVCLQDIDFYEESDGGVTISGGEGMSQPTFVKELVTSLKNHHIHTAIETTGHIDPLIFQELAPLFDLLLFDVKHYDSQKHFEGTGVHYEIIQKNLRWAIQHGMKILPRIPVIPDFNDSLKDAEKFAQYFIEIGINHVQLLPFHQFGEKKYELLNREYSLKNKKALYPEDLQDYQKVFLKHDLNCFF